MTADAGLLSLDMPAARDPRCAGAKAARLAQAWAAGLPVLPGVVVPASVSAAALSRGAVAAGQGGSAAARLAVLDAPVEDRLRRDLVSHAARLGSTLVVRSSSPLEGDPTWAGAFTSYLGVAAGELVTAVRGCWASVFGRAALERAAHVGVRPEDLGLSVLAQPELEFEVSGTATRRRDGTVEITWVAGSPAPLVSGWEPGRRVVVAADGDADRDAGAGVPLGAGLATAIVDLAGRVAAEFGDAHLEWGSHGGAMVLLQSRSGSDTPAAPPPPATPAGCGSVAAARLARAIARCTPTGAGGVAGAEQLILPWAAALPELPPPSAPLPYDAAAALALRLTEQAWSRPADEARRILAAIRDGLRSDALAMLEQLSPVDARAAAQLVATAALAPAEPRTARASQGRWEPFLGAVALATGTPHRGDPAAPGLG
ncbi:MAG: PEP/pyruvate-binding domain-containing protein, partial [Streptomycetales bacterium]